MDDDFPAHPKNPCPQGLTERQTCLLSKLVTSTKTKFDETLAQRSNAALAINPANTLNTKLKVSAKLLTF
jgi:hypothetical protein